MRKLLSVLVLAFACPAFASFDVGTKETFDKNLDGWATKGEVHWSNYANNKNGYAQFGDLFSNKDNKLSNTFVAQCTGTYALSFDYRFRGIDCVKPDDKVEVTVGFGKKDVYDVFETKSSVGLTGGLLCPGQWQTVTTPPPVITLEKGKTYWICFEMKEACGILSPITNLDIDNICVSKVSCVPAPGAVVLCSLGSIFVGWLRKRQSI